MKKILAPLFACLLWSCTPTESPVSTLPESPQTQNPQALSYSVLTGYDFNSTAFGERLASTQHTPEGQLYCDKPSFNRAHRSTIENPEGPDFERFCVLSVNQITSAYGYTGEIQGVTLTGGTLRVQYHQEERLNEDHMLNDFIRAEGASVLVEKEAVAAVKTVRVDLK